MAKTKVLDLIAMILVIIGGLNWLLVGLFKWNLVEKIFGFSPTIRAIIYVLVGLGAIYMIYFLVRKK